MNQQTKSDQTKNEILDAANRVLMEQGVECFTLEAIAAEARVSKGGLLYHFASKNALIAGMMERSMAQVDQTLEEELERSDGDYLTAYICASFRTTADPAQVSRAIQAAIVRDPALLTPLRERFERMQREISQRASSPELGLLVRLAMDGLWYSELYQFAPPDGEQRRALQTLLLDIARKSAEDEGEQR
jgi:AcrR family transcriptional regulator